jgi:Uma2 family endonuclease
MAVRRGVQFLATDIWDTPDDGKRYEVIDGELFVTPPPIWKHQRGLSKLHIRLGVWIYGNNLGEIVTAPVGVVLDENNGLQPDLVYISRERLSIIHERGVEGAPDLVVEVLSPSTRARDKGIKMRRYAAAGVSHYWLLDPKTESLEAYRLAGQGYEMVGHHGPGSVFRPALFPGLDIPIDDLWR